MDRITPSPDRTGLLAGFGAHLFWGSMPLYLLLVQNVPAVEFVAWRILFTLPLCFAIAAWRRHGKELRRVLANRRAMLTLTASAALIGVNWLLYVWAIKAGHVYAASLGYYMLPLLMMVMGVVLLHERLSWRRWLAVALAGCGVAALAAGALTTLWVSLALALSFAIYGLLRKTVAAGSLVGLTVESLILLPVALAILAWYATSPAGSSAMDGWETVLAIAWGAPMTATPLLLFTVAARRLPYTVMGFLQFTSPTIIFVLGLTVFGQSLEPAQIASFALIWGAAGLFLLDLLRSRPVRG